MPASLVAGAPGRRRRAGPRGRAGPGVLTLDPACAHALHRRSRRPSPSVRCMAAGLLGRTSVERAGGGAHPAPSTTTRTGGARRRARGPRVARRSARAAAAALACLARPDDRRPRGRGSGARRPCRTICPRPSRRCPSIASWPRDPSPAVRASVACLLGSHGLRTSGRAGSSRRCSTAPDEHWRMAGLDASAARRRRPDRAAPDAGWPILRAFAAARSMRSPRRATTDDRARTSSPPSTTTAESVRTAAAARSRAATSRRRAPRRPRPVGPTEPRRPPWSRFAATARTSATRSIAWTRARLDRPGPADAPGWRRWRPAGTGVARLDPGRFGARLPRCTCWADATARRGPGPRRAGRPRRRRRPAASSAGALRSDDPEIACPGHRGARLGGRSAAVRRARPAASRTTRSAAQDRDAVDAATGR